MSEDDALNRAMRDDPRQRRRDARAARTRAAALSPRRLLVSLLTLPLVIAALTLSIFLRTSEHDAPGALLDLLALGGCEALGFVGAPPPRAGQPGYDVRLDPDGDGIACEPEGAALPGPVAGGQKAASGFAPEQRMVGGAKFVRP